MMKPSIHLNGTSVQELKFNHELALRGIRQALDLMVKCDPHARDYYPQGPAAFPQAQKEYVIRLQKLMSVRNELEELYEYLCDMEDK